MILIFFQAQRNNLGFFLCLCVPIGPIKHRRALSPLLRLHSEVLVCLAGTMLDLIQDKSALDKLQIPWAFIFWCLKALPLSVIPDRCS